MSARSVCRASRVSVSASPGHLLVTIVMSIICVVVSMAVMVVIMVIM